MKYGSVFMLCAMVAVLTLCLMGPAQAARDDSISADQDLAQQKGLGSKEIDQSKMPGALEYAIVIGSVIAAIGVIKFV